MHLGLQKGELPLVEYEEYIRAPQDQEKENGTFYDDEDVPGPDTSDEGIMALDIPDKPEDDYGQPSHLHNHKNEDGWPAFRILHGLIS